MTQNGRHTATLGGWLWLPSDAVDMGWIREHLTHQPRRRMDGTMPDKVELFQEHPDAPIIGVPQAFGIEVFGKSMDIDDQTVAGEPMAGASEYTLPDPNNEAVKEPDRQALFMQDMLEAARTHEKFLAVAPTGSGKTVVGSRTSILLGRKTLILVHRSKILDQWRDTLVRLCGVPPERIGRVHEGVADWQDKDFVLGTYQTIALRPHRYPEGFYNSFGLVMFDEVHLCGAPVFHQAAWQFPAQYRIGLTATPERKDGSHYIFFWHIGPIRAVSEQSALPLTVWPIWYHCGNYPLWGKSHSARMKCLSRDRLRNQRIAGLVQRMHAAGRNMIVVSDYIDHLQTLRQMSIEAGVSEGDTGMFVGKEYYLADEPVPGTNRTQQVRKHRPIKKRVLDRVVREAKIIFTTYGMIREGVDIRRLDGGIDALPRSDATQLIGRIRRPHEGKRSPILWLTMVDANCDRSLRYYGQRCDEYRASGAEVVDVRST